MILAVLTGAVAGIIHVFSGPDHLAAVAPLAAQRRLGTWKTGLFWGLGHTWGVWLIAIVAVTLKHFISLEPLSAFSERLVGATLIVIGLTSLRRAITLKVHYHEHEHDGRRHAHFHVHAKAHDAERKTRHEHSHVPLGIGLLHGIAGSAHLVAVLPAIALPSVSAGTAYVAGYGVGTIAAMTGFSWVVGHLVGTRVMRLAPAYNVALAILAVAALAVGVVWVTGPA